MIQALATNQPFCESNNKVGFCVSHFIPTTSPIAKRNCHAHGLKYQRWVNEAGKSAKICVIPQMTLLMASVDSQFRSPTIKKAGTRRSVSTMYNTRMSEITGGLMRISADHIEFNGCCCDICKAAWARITSTQDNA